MSVYLHDRHGNLLKEFGKTKGSNGYKGICANMIGAKISLWHKTETWDTKSFEVAHLPLGAMNGVDLEIDVKKAIKDDDNEEIVLQ